MTSRVLTEHSRPMAFNFRSCEGLKLQLGSLVRFWFGDVAERKGLILAPRFSFLTLLWGHNVDEMQCRAWGQAVGGTQTGVMHDSAVVRSHVCSDDNLGTQFRLRPREGFLGM